MDENLKNAISACRTEVERDAQHRMSFARRRALLLALGPQQLDARGSGVELAVGKRRRVLLALQVSRRVAPFWARDFGTPALDSLLDQIQEYLAGAVPRADVRRKTDSLQGGLLNDPMGKDQAYLAGRAVAGAGWVAVGDELLSTEQGMSEEDLADPEDPDLWDPAFYAAGAWAGGMPWTPTFSATAYRDFWQWYLDDAVPQAWRSVVE